MRGSAPSAYNPSPMTSRRPVAAASRTGARARTQHTLAPAHLGDATAAATVAVVVGGIALAITGIGVIAMALTMGSRYGSDPPPNVGSLIVLPAAAGALFLLLGIGLAAGGVAVLAGVARSRMLTGVLAGIAALLALVGTVLAVINAPPDAVVAVALGIATVVFGAAALLLLRGSR